MDIANVHQNDKEVRAVELLEKVGLDQDQIHRRILKLSGEGQQQRVAIARALVLNHEIIIADEPTGNLDEETTAQIVELFKEIAHKDNKIVILVTHENEVAKVAKCNNPEYPLEIGKTVVKIDPQYYRPTEVDLLIGDPTKSKTQLGWEPKYDLAGLVKEMMQSDLKLM